MRYQKLGLLHHEPARCFGGYTLVAPIRHLHIYLIDMAGEVVHRWNLPGPLGSKALLLPGGNLLFSTVTAEGAPIRAAKGGHIMEMDWDGNVVWERVDHDQHHDIRRLDNGNTVYVAWEVMSDASQARVRGGMPGTERDGKIYGDVFREVDPGGKLAWEWRLEDQEIEKFPISDDCERYEYAHSNSCAPTPDGNYLINFRSLDTMMLVERATKEIVWSHRDWTWGHPHNPEMLADGNITFYANGMNNARQVLHSRALEMDPADFSIVWEYKDPQKWTFFSPVMGSVQRLDNGNTLINEAVFGRLFEVTPDKEIVWEYINPHFHPVPDFDGPSNAMFRAYRYAPDSPELSGKL